MGAKTVPCYNRICAINDCVIMRLQCMFKPMKKGSMVQSVESSRHIESSKNYDLS